MNNISRYNNVFIKLFNVKEEELDELKYKGIEAWDSVGQMELLANLEDEFEIFFEMDDMVVMNSYAKGIEILKRYGIEF